MPSQCSGSLSLGHSRGGRVKVESARHALVLRARGQRAREGQDRGHAVVALPLQVGSLFAAFAAAVGERSVSGMRVAAVIAAEHDQRVLGDAHFAELFEDPADLVVQGEQGRAE